jgi:hypothetical protein
MAWQHCLDSTTQQILQATTAEFVGKATSIDEQLPSLYQEQEKLADQISVTEECIEDYIASMTEGLLHGFAYQRSLGDVNPFRAEWQVGTTYSQLDMVQVTNGDSPFGYEYYICTLSNTGDVAENKPGEGTGWMLYWMSIGTTPLTHPPYIVELGGSFNNKIYGAQLEDFRIYEIITPPPPPLPDPPLPPYEENKYFYHGGPWYTLNDDVDGQIDTNHGDWGAANDLVTRPFLEDAFYGLKAKYDNVGKAIDYLQNTKNKYIAMVPLLGKFIK